ncbi:MAG: hypothetical protein LC803_19275 [Acidobacteria bacterium]|nr:hypothetical protein [Acidobacteriota bacterium]
MKRTISILTALSMMLTLCSFSFKSSAQKPAKDKETKEERLAKVLKANWNRLPPLAKLGASPEAKAAWDGLTEQEREAVKAKVHSVLGKETGKLKTDKEARKAAVKRWKELRKTDDDVTLSFVSKDGKQKTVKAKKQEVATMDDDLASARAIDKKENGRARAITAARKPAATQRPANAQKFAAPWDERWAATNMAHFNKASFRKASFGRPAAATQSADADIDGLPESFEDALAENFHPIYHTSAGEVDNYSTFHDMTPQTVKDRFGQNPVLYYRVTPLYIRYNPYRYMYESFIRIDYLTLWDHDSGLPDTTGCDISEPFGSLVQNIGGPHDIDNERSAMLVSAPVFDPYNDWSFNLDANQYSALSVFTAAHEGTFTDQSAYHNFPQNPMWPGSHIELWHSLFKHATYTSNPNFHALLPEYVIFTEFFFLGYFFFDFYNPFCREEFWDWSWDWNFSDCPNSDPWSNPYFYLYLASFYYAVVVTFGCVVERFHEQGGRFANPRINVGETFQPINGSSFILDNTYSLYNKLRSPLAFENLIQ